MPTKITRSDVLEPKFLERFLSQQKKSANPDLCWAWKDRLARDGYAKVDVNGKAVGVHRVAWVIANGEIPDELDVCHTCDNPPCTNPAHLWLGTHAQNMEDKVRKGRHKINACKGEDHPNSKLSARDIQRIRASKGIVSQRELARRFNVSQPAIHFILNGKNWPHLAQGSSARSLKPLKRKAGRYWKKPVHPKTKRCSKQTTIDGSFHREGDSDAEKGNSTTPGA